MRALYQDLPASGPTRGIIAPYRWSGGDKPPSDYAQSSGWGHRVPGIAGILARAEHGGPSAARGLEARDPRRSATPESRTAGMRIVRSQEPPRRRAERRSTPTREQSRPQDRRASGSAGNSDGQGDVQTSCPGSRRSGAEDQPKGNEQRRTRWKGLLQARLAGRRRHPGSGVGLDLRAFTINAMFAPEGASPRALPVAAT